MPRPPVPVQKMLRLPERAFVFAFEDAGHGKPAQVHGADAGRAFGRHGGGGHHHRSTIIPVVAQKHRLGHVGPQRLCPGTVEEGIRRVVRAGGQEGSLRQKADAQARVGKRAGEAVRPTLLAVAEQKLSLIHI